MWKDFPKGLRVLLLDEDSTSAAETKSKLEAMDYVVFLYCNEKDALEAITSKTESFHVAIVEVTSESSYGSFRFLEMAKDLPTIVISNVPCISTTVKCIALGAAEFLQKPLSEDKLRNIWQHVVHKVRTRYIDGNRFLMALWELEREEVSEIISSDHEQAFNAGGDVLSKSLEPIKETIVSMLQVQSDKDEIENESQFESEIKQKYQEQAHLNTDELDSLSVPSTPQLVKGGRFMEAGDFHEQTIFSLEKDNIEDKDLSVVKKYAHFETKYVDNTCNNLTSADRNSKEVLTSNPKEAADEEEVDSTDGSRTKTSIAVKEGSQASDVHDKDNIKSVTDELKKRKSSHVNTSCSHGNQCSRKKIKVDWTPELHKKFVQAVEQLGIDQAIPSKILELMKVEGLTRHNIASHLQKYRMHRRHILPKDSDNRWQLQMYRDHMLRGCMRRPPMVLPPFHSNYGLPLTQVYPVWGHPSYRHPGAPMWGYPSLSTSTWNPPQGNWLWNTYPGIQAEAWGCPVVPPYSQCSIPAQNTTMNNSSDATGGRRRDLKDFSDFYLKDEVIDEVVEEAVSKPWLPLPLGLKPPSTDSVLAELHRQGISTIPPIHR